MKWKPLGLLICILFGWSVTNVALAAKEENVTSIHSGATAYLAVTPGKGASERELGFYTRQGSDWDLAFPGYIHLDQTMGPALLQLEVSKSDKKSQMIALIDGYITLISQATRRDNEASYLVMGSVAHPIVHPITGTPIYLPNLDSTEKVRLLEVKSNGHTIVFVSVQVQEQLGYTFAFGLASMSGQELATKSPLTLVHEGFLDTQELENLASYTEDYWVSSTIVGQFVVKGARRESKKYSGLLDQWESELDTISTAHGIVYPVVSVSLLDHEFESGVPPYFPVGGGMAQVLDFRSAEKYLTLESSARTGEKIEESEIIRGSIDLDENSKPFYRSLEVGGFTLEVLGLDGKLVVGRKNRLKKEKLELVANRVPENMSLTYVDKEIGDETTKYQVIASLKGQKGNSTEIWELTFDHQTDELTGLRVIPFRFFRQEFYASDDLQDRFRRVEDAEGNMHLLFMPLEQDQGDLGDQGINIQESMARADVVLGVPEFPDKKYFRLIKVPNGHELQYRDTRAYVLSLPQSILDLEIQLLEATKENEEAFRDEEPIKELLGFVKYKPGEKEDTIIELVYLKLQGKNLRKNHLNISRYLKHKMDGPLSPRLIEEEDDQGNPVIYLDVSKKADKTELIDIKASVTKQERVDSLRGNEHLEAHQKNLQLASEFAETFPGLKLRFDEKDSDAEVNVMIDGGNAIISGKIKQVPKYKEEGGRGYQRIYRFEFMGHPATLRFLPFTDGDILNGALAILSWLGENEKVHYRVGAIDLNTTQNSVLSFSGMTDFRILVNGPVTEEDLVKYRQKELKKFMKHIVDDEEEINIEEELEEFLNQKHKETGKRPGIGDNSEIAPDEEVTADDLYELKLKRLEKLWAKYEAVDLSDYDDEISQLTRAEYKLVQLDTSQFVPASVEISLAIETGGKEKGNQKDGDEETTGAPETSLGAEDQHGKKKSKRRKPTSAGYVTPNTGAQPSGWAMRKHYTINFNFKNENHLIGNLGTHAVDRESPASSEITLNHMLAKRFSRWYWVTESADDVHAKSLEVTDIHVGDRSYKPNESQGRRFRRHLKFEIPVEQRPVRFINSRFSFTGSWKVERYKVADVLNQWGGFEVNEYMAQLFHKIVDDIQDYVSRPGKKKMKVLLLPKAIHPLVMSYLSHQFREGEGRVWSENNKDLRVFIPELDAAKGRIKDDEPVNQYNVVDNIEVISQVDPSHNLLYLPLSEMDDGATPTNPDRLSIYENLHEVSVGKRSMAESAALKSSKRAISWPHLSFILATQGDGQISYEGSRELNKELPFPVLMIGTQDEWKEFSEQAGEFLNYGFDEWFDVDAVSEPSMDAKVELLISIFRDPHIQLLGYKFDPKGINRIKEGDEPTEEEKMRSVLRYAVNRVESNARNMDSNPFTIYLDFLSLFSQTLVQDRAVRNKQVVDKALIEVMMSKMFSIPLNRNFLPKDDPLYLLSRPDAAVKMQEAGYNGPIPLKRRFIDVLTSQLTQAQTKPIPSSMILAGDTGSGKTHTFESLVKMLSLKLYSFDRNGVEDNDEANAIVIKADKLIDSAGKTERQGSSNAMTVVQAIKHLEHFLSLPNGYRGFVLIDDLHGAPDSVREKLLQYLRALFESRDGMYSIESQKISLGSKEVMIKPTRRPVRGLNLFVTMNFTEDQQKLAKFSKKPGDPTLEELILATLSTRNYSLEKSFLRRWGDIIPLSTFPAEAKAPGLLDAFFKRSKDTLELRSKLAILSPKLVRKIVSQFKATDARTFLADATNILFTLFDQGEESDSVQIIVPSPNGRGEGVESRGDLGQGAFDEESSLELEHMAAQSEIGRYVFRNSQIITVNENYEGQIHLLKWVLGNFRILMFESFLRGLEESHHFSADQEAQQINLYPMVQAMYDHLNEHEDLPLVTLNLDPALFGLTQVQEKNEFAKYVASVDKSASDSSPREYFPIGFVDAGQFGLFYEELTHQKIGEPPRKSRKSVISNSLAQIEPEVKSELASYFRLGSMSQFPSSEDWVAALKKKDPSTHQQFGERLVENFLEMRRQMYDSSMTEVINYEKHKSLTAYHGARIYLYVLDRAIARMPWESAIAFFAHTMRDVSLDMTLSQSPGFQWLLTDSKYSPLRPLTNDLLIANLTNFPAFKEQFREQRERQRKGFRSDCQLIIDGKGGK